MAKLSLQSKNSKLALISIITVLAVIGVYFVYRSRAAQPAASIEAERGQITGNASANTDSTASENASVVLGTGSTGSNIANWSDPLTWGGSVPVANATVVIPAGKKVAVNVDVPKLKRVIIPPTSELVFADRATTFTTGSILVEGKLTLGTQTTPLNNNITIKLDDEITSKTEPKFPSTNPIRQIGDMNNSDPAIGYNGLIIYNGGSVDVHGRDVGKSWTKMSSTAKPGTKIITLDEAVSWPVGSEITLASAFFDPLMAERATVAGVSADGKTVTLAANLKYRHAGVVNTQTANGETRSLPQKSEVGLLTRNIKIVGPDIATQSLLGGHIQIFPTSIGRFSNVELVRMGQKGVLGRYPFHYHYNGDASASFVNKVSVHDSFNRFVTIHATNNLQVNDGVYDGTFGHGMMFEDGVENNNKLNRNLVMGVKRPMDTNNFNTWKASNTGVDWSKYPTCQETNPQSPTNNGKTFGHSGDCFVRISDDISSEFWVSNPDNDFVGNSAAGGDGIGFWYDFLETSDNFCISGLQLANQLKGAGEKAYCQATTADKRSIGDNIDNVSHSHIYPCTENYTADPISAVRRSQSCGNSSDYATIRITCIRGGGFCFDGLQGASEVNRGNFRNTNAWMNRDRAYWLEGGITFTNLMAANNGEGGINATSHINGGVVISAGTALSDSFSPADGDPDITWQGRYRYYGSGLSHYHGNADTENLWFGGYAMFNNTTVAGRTINGTEAPYWEKHAAIFDTGSSGWPNANRFRKITFFDNWPNSAGNSSTAARRVSMSFDNCSGNDVTGGEAWILDLDGSVKGNGIPAVINNLTPGMWPVSNRTVYNDTNGNRNCSGADMGTNGGKPRRSGGMEILYPYSYPGQGDRPADNAFYNILSDQGSNQSFAGLVGVDDYQYVRQSDNLAVTFNGNDATILMNQIYKVKANSSDSATTNSEFRIVANMPGWIELDFKWGAAGGVLRRGGCSGTAMSQSSSLASLRSANQNTYYIETLGSGERRMHAKFYISAAPPFGQPLNFAGINIGNDTTWCVTN